MTETKERQQICIDDPVLVLVGPTAIGKTALSLKLAQRFNAEIVSVDSMQVYRYMDIGTAKASPEERELIPHHLIDIVDPDQEYNAARFVADASEAIRAIHRRGKSALLTGGTGLYLRALCNGLFPAPATNQAIREDLNQKAAEAGTEPLYRELSVHDPVTAARVHPHDTARIIRALEVFLTTRIPMSKHMTCQHHEPVSALFSNMLTIGLKCPRSRLYERINQRTSLMCELGLEQEVRRLLDQGFHGHLKSMQSIGYRHMLKYLQGEWTDARTRELLARDTRRYAKRQFTWFNRDQSIAWFDHAAHDDIFRFVTRWFSAKSS